MKREASAARTNVFKCPQAAARVFLEDSSGGDWLVPLQRRRATSTVGSSRLKWAGVSASARGRAGAGEPLLGEPWCLFVVGEGGPGGVLLKLLAERNHVG